MKPSSRTSAFGLRAAYRRRAARTWIAVVALATACLAGLQGNAAASLPTAAVPHSLGAAAVASVGCGAPVSKRVGAWLCGEPSAGLMAAAATGYCNVTGCWTRNNDFNATYEGNASFGYGSTQLGTAEVDHTWQLTGTKSATTVAVIRFKTLATTVETLYISGQMYNGAPGVKNGGNPISGTYAQSPKFGAGLLSYNWKGYAAIDNKNHDHNVVMEFAWTLQGYSGYWYVYTRSLVSDASDLKIYRFDSVSQLPGNPQGGGWNPN